ncbi:hypothetical protein JCM8547_005029 [Rhodosporidiobolus lusitaniae]
MPSLFTSLLSGALLLRAASAHNARELAKDPYHQAVARDMSSGNLNPQHERIEKRYPPNRETFIPTTTPVWMASQTPAASAVSSRSSSSSSSAAAPTATSAPSGQFATPTTRALVAATTSTATTCAGAYVAPTTIFGTGTLPKPSTFVRKQQARSDQLVLDGAPFRIVGPNIYWLCQDENVGWPKGQYTDKGRIREALAIAVAMGANTIRAHTCGISVGQNEGSGPYNLEPTYRNFNSAAWDIRDYALYAAREYGLRVIVPFTDNYNYYHGGKYQFINFRFASTANAGLAFYNNRVVLNAFLEYIGQILNHVNPYTGVAWKDDPTILAWETGNELGGYIQAETWPTFFFTMSVVQYISKYDKNHLILDGTNGFWNYTTGATAPALTNRGVAMVTDHGYPRNTGILNREIQLAKDNFKNFLIGEYDWTSTQSSVSLDAYIAALEASSTIGDMIWNVMGHDAQCCAFVSHNDGYSLYYPNGNSANDQLNALKVVQHWHRVRGLTPPSQLKGVACPQPVF